MFIELFKKYALLFTLALVVLGGVLVFFIYNSNNAWTITILESDPTAPKYSIDGNTIKLTSDDPCDDTAKVKFAGIGIKWWDGTTTGDCKWEHTYTVNWIYEIHFTKWHAWPTDFPVTDSDAVIKIEVKWIPSWKNKIKNIVFENEKFDIGSSISLRYDLSLFQKIGKVEYSFHAAKNDEQIGKSKIDTNTNWISGSSTVKFWLMYPPEINQYILSGTTVFYVKISVLDEQGGIILSSKSPKFELKDLELPLGMFDFKVIEATEPFYNVQYLLFDSDGNQLDEAIIRWVNRFFSNAKISQMFNHHGWGETLYSIMMKNRYPLVPWTSYRVTFHIKSTWGATRTIEIPYFTYKIESLPPLPDIEIPSETFPKYTVQAFFTEWDPCHTYLIEWWDGTITKNTNTRDSECILWSTYAVESHSYASPGTYTVKLHDSSTQHGGEAVSLYSMYYATTVTVK